MSGLQSGTIIAHMHTEIQDGGHECRWFYEKLKQTYKAIYSDCMQEYWIIPRAACIHVY